MKTSDQRAALSMVAMAELALIRRNQAVFARLREAVELDPDLTAALLDHASSAILEEVARAASLRPIGRKRQRNRPAASASRFVPPYPQPPEKDRLT